MYKYIRSCIYIHIYMSAHIHTYTHTHTKCTHERTHARLERRRDSETSDEPLQTQEALNVSFVRRNQTTFRTSNARTSLYPLHETPVPLHPPIPSSQHTQEQFADRGQAQFYSTPHTVKPPSLSCRCCRNHSEEIVDCREFTESR